MLSAAGRLVSRSQSAGTARKPSLRSNSSQTAQLTSLKSVRTIVTDYDLKKIYTSRQLYTIFNTLERAKSIDRPQNIGANVIATRLNQPLHLNELKDALDFVQAKHTKLQFAAKTILEGGGVYGKVDSALPLEIEERQEDDEAHLQVAMETFLQRPMTEHLMKVKVLAAPESCDIVFGVSNGAADVASTGMLVDEVMARYAQLIKDPSKAATTVETAPIVDELANIFPSSTKSSFLGWKGIMASMRSFTNSTKALQAQSPFRFPTDPSASSFFTLELSPELTQAIEHNAATQGTDLLSAIAAGTSLASKKKLFKLSQEIQQDINVDFNITHDLRSAGFMPPIPNDTMTLAEIPSYHSVLSGNTSGDRSVWDVAKDIFKSTQDTVASDSLFDAYHFSVTAASVRARKLGSIPHPPFDFQNAGNLYISPRTIEQLAIDDIRVAETALPGTCKVIIGKFNRKLQLSFNFQDHSMSAQEAEAVTDVALELLRDQPSATNATVAEEQTTQTN